MNSMMSTHSEPNRSGISRAAAIGILAVVSLLVGLLFAFSALSGPSQADSHQPAKPVERVFTLTQQEWGFNQTKGGPIIIVSKGEKISLQVKNTGQFPHDIAVTDKAGNVLWNAKSKEPQQPGSSAKIEFTAQQAGTYRLVCTIPGHSQLGMEAQITVQSP